MNAWINLWQEFILLFKNGQIPEWGYWSYLALALLVAVEGPIATLLGAAAASAGAMRPQLVFLAATAGNLTADTLWYAIGYMGKIEWLYHLGERTGINRNRIEHMQFIINKHAIKVLFFAKLSMSLMIPSLIAAGLVKARWRSWFPAVFGGEIIWTGGLVLIGYYSTEAIKRVEQGLEYFILGASILFILFIVWISRRILRESDAEFVENRG